MEQNLSGGGHPRHRRGHLRPHPRRAVRTRQQRGLRAERQVRRRHRVHPEPLPHTRGRRAGCGLREDLAGIHPGTGNLFRLPQGSDGRRVQRCEAAVGEGPVYGYVRDKNLKHGHR